jgi:succinate dehydrogenase / fumarate reductase cytochrome b subunit
MWLVNSSVGKKVIMSVTGLFLVLFVTFHVLMNAVALICPQGYNAVCKFLGANWYALIGTMVLAAGFVIHILYAFWLTWTNRKARGNDRYAINERPATVEWASQNMLVLGIIVVCFLLVHFIQFWYNMQFKEVAGLAGAHDPADGCAYIADAFGHWWTLVIYLIGFAALWFHMTHGFWSAFQTIGTTNEKWINRWKCIAMWWASIVCILFAVEAITFTAGNARYQNVKPECPTTECVQPAGCPQGNPCQAMPCDKKCAPEQGCPNADSNK